MDTLGLITGIVCGVIFLVSAIMLTFGKNESESQKKDLWIILVLAFFGTILNLRAVFGPWLESVSQ